MKTLVIERFEGSFVICVGEDKKLFAIDRAEAPAGAKEGAVLCIDDEGTLTLDKAVTAAREKKAKR